jgi:FtsH-binding integral membrane protein
MENNSLNPFAPAGQQAFVPVADPTMVRTFLTRVFTFMALALVLSGVAAWLFGTIPMFQEYLRDAATGRPTMVGWVVMLAPLGLVLLMGGMVNRLSAPAMLGVFALYAVLTGMSISYIFLIYNLASIGSIFLISAAVFATMAIAGYTTRTGIVIAGLVNMFLQSGTMGYVISMLAVAIFTGLIAYDMQRLKNMAGHVVPGTDAMQKLALMGALSMYLNFLNLFLSLLRLFGGRRD